MDIYPTHKICSKCHTSKLLEEFYKNSRNKKDGRHAWCKGCHKIHHITYNKSPKIKEYSKVYQQNHKEDYHRNHLYHRYGLTGEQWNKMFDDQNGECAMCHTHQSKLKTRLCVDHCHTTGKVRGLLCDNCNKGLGYYKDSKYLLTQALNYLNIHHPD